MTIAHQNENDPGATLHQKRLSGTLYLVVISSVAALGGLLFGYDTAVISGAIGLLQSHFSLGAAAAGWAASSALAGCVLGSVVADRKSTRLNSSHANISY